MERLDLEKGDFVAPARAKGLWILLCSYNLDWKLGRVARFNPKAKKYNFEIAWGNNGIVEYQRCDLELFYARDATAPPVPGSWCYFKEVATDPEPVAAPPPAPPATVERAPEVVPAAWAAAASEAADGADEGTHTILESSNPAAFVEAAHPLPSAISL